jgi:hypothetical protein
MRSLPRSLPCRRALALLAGLCAAPAAAQQAPPDTVEVPPIPASYHPPAPAAGSDSLGLRFRLSQGTTGAPDAARSAPDATPLPAAAAARLLDRLPPLRRAESAADSFAFPAQSPPPPRTGATVHAAFPPPAGDAGPPPAAPSGGALEVVRRSPEGRVETGSGIVVVFSRPMVALGAPREPAAREVPARLAPQPPGRWRWLDARTLVFEPAGRMPPSTRFTVEVPAGTRAADGAALARAAAWSFTTAPPRASGAYPNDEAAARQPVLVVAWNQEVDAAAALAALRLEAGGREHPLRPATPAEVEADPRAREIARDLPAGLWTAFRPVRPLPADTPVSVTVGAAAPAAEPEGSGPVQEWGFHTYGPLRVAKTECAWGPSCPPESGWSIGFNNSLDPASWSDSLVRVEPAVAGLRVDLYGDRLVLSGGTLPNTVYGIHLHPSIRDAFGQALGARPPVEIAVGPRSPAIWTGMPRMVVLDPAGPARVPFYTRDVPRVRLRIHRVSPEDWPAFTYWRYDAKLPRALPGEELVSRVVETGAPEGSVAETTVDLAPFLEGGPGQLVLAVEPADTGAKRRASGDYVWIQSTRIGLATVSDGERLSALATSLADGAPLAGVELRFRGEKPSVVTGADGVATLPSPRASRQDAAVVARRGDDVAFLPDETWWQPEPEARLAWYVVTDRRLYRPGEEVRFKGWVRRLTPDTDAQPVLLGRDFGPLRFTVEDADGNEIRSGALPLSGQGGFDGRFTVPAGASLGTGVIHVEAAGRSRQPRVVVDWTFEIQEFRRPEFVAEVEAASGPHLAGGSAQVVARASYFGGGALPGAEVHWRASAERGRFTPPGWDGWSFGDDASADPPPVVRTLSGRTGAGGEHALRLDFERASPPLPATLKVEATVVDLNRQAWTAQTRLLVHPAEVYAGLRTGRAWVEADRPVEWEVAVVDLSGRPAAGREVEVWAGSESGRWEAGEWTPGPRAQSCRGVSAAAPLRCAFRPAAGGLFHVAARVRDAAGRPSWTRSSVWVSGAAAAQRPERGRPVEGRVEMVADRAEYLPGDTAEVLLRSPVFPARGMLTVVRAGIARSEPLEVRGAAHVLRVPVAEGDVPNVRLRVDLAGDPRGAAGDTAAALPTDFAAGTLELDVPPTRRALAVRPTPRDTLAAPDSRTGVEVEVRDAAGRPVPGAEVALLVVDEAVLALSGYRHPDPLALFHPRRREQLYAENLRPYVLLAPRDLPTAPGTLVGTVKDGRTGAPLGGAVVEVRETGARAATDGYGRFRIAALRPGTYTLVASHEGLPSDERTVRVGAEAHPPIRFVLGSAAVVGLLQGRVAGLELGGLVVTGTAADPPPPFGEAMARRARDGDDGEEIALRTDFRALAHFAPAVRTDAAGRARVDVRLPSNLTRYRVVTVGVAGDRLSGLGESAITARLGLTARPSPPRFLNVGDRFELPVTVQNLTARALEVDVALRAEGLEVDSAGRRVVVPAGDRVEVRFPAAATHPGTARVQVAAAGGGLADAAEVSLPVWTPASAEAFATYGVVDSGAVVLPLRVPSGVLPGYGGLEVTTSSTAVQELTDALLYLVRYPYECTEQMASRLASVAALRDVLTAFRAADMPSPQAMRASVERDVAALARLQNDDGGWGFWERGEPSWPFVSVHVAHALQRAREKGYAVPEEVLEEAADYLREAERRVPASYPERERRSVAAYAAYVRARMGDPEAAAAARRLLDGAAPGVLSLEARGWILSALAGKAEHRDAAAALVRDLTGQARETAAAAEFADAYAQGEYLLLHSARRTDAVVLDALIAAAPESDLIPKTVRGLLGHRRAGRWESTQENAWVLFALDRYFAAYEGRTPDFQARAWLGDRFAGGHRFRGRTTERHHLAVPMRALPAGDSVAPLVLDKQGAGRMYYRAGLRYAPASAQLDAAQAGFGVERVYEAVDDSADVRRGADGVWRIRAGARVRVRLTLTAPGRRHHVALADPLPGGLEPLNPGLLGVQQDPGDDEDDEPYSWRAYWWEHQNLRDERAEAFTSLLPAGVYAYSYLARATTPGSFVVPPARAEEMYAPETFGRTASGRVVVEPR